MFKVSVIIPVYNQEILVERAIRSIPKRDDIEIIVIDDASTDKTFETLMRLRDKLHNFTILCNKENKGVGYTVNRGYDAAQGEYVVLLGSDDYFYQGAFMEAYEQLDGTDIVYFNLQTNDGRLFMLNEETKYGFCGSVKFIRRKFLGDTRCPEIRAGEDWHFYHRLMEKKPTEKFTNLIVKHYNFPRTGSLYDQLKKGELSNDIPNS